MALSLQQLARALGGDVSGDQVLAPGPGHSPRDRSLSVKPTGNDYIVFSHSGDSWERCKDYVKDKLGIGAAPPKANGSKTVASYDYHNENGDLLFQVMRQEPKGFRQRRPDGKGGHIWNMDGARRVPYRLPELLKAASAGEAIFVVEGEKAADALIKLGVPSTCSPGGAGKWKPEYAQHFAGAGDVFILPDNDDAGEKHAADVMQSMPFARIIRLPGLLDKGDAFDWIAAGGTADKLAEIVAGAPCEYGPDSPLIMRCAADVEPEPIDWLWAGRIARGKLTVIGGDPEEGKSTLGTDITARISTGSEWPNHEGRAPVGSVIILSAEDGAEDTLVPRLIAGGADLKKVHLVEAVQSEDKKGRRTFSLQTDLELLEARINHIGDVQAIIVDPASAYLGKNVDSHNDQSVRNVLAPVAEMAHRLDVAIISVMHLNKGGGQHTKVMHRFMASIAFVAAARIGFAAMRDPEDDTKHLFLHAKNNLAPRPPGLAYRIEQRLVTEMLIKTSCIVWEPGSVDITAEQAMAASKAPEDAAPALEEAKQFLATTIGTDGMHVKEIEKEAKDAGLSWATVRRAKDKLKLISERDGYGGPWMWKKR